jgi:prolipoprotein diacylglyceryltransferase
MGMILSVPMVIAGAIIMFWAWRRKPPDKLEIPG